MNTQVYLWIEPMVMHHERCSDKVYFNCIIEGDHTHTDNTAIEDLIGGRIMDSIMDFSDISCNWNYGVISSTATKKKPIIEYATSPEKIIKDKDEKIAKNKEEVRITKIINSKKPLKLIKDNIEIKDNGKLEINLPILNLKKEIDFLKIWRSLKEEIIGKIKEGEKVILADDDGNILFELVGGSFLNVGLADLSVYDKNTMPENRSLFNHYEGLEGGLFVREDGRLDIGDSERTFWLRIYTDKLLKASLKKSKNLNELIDIKLLK